MNKATATNGKQKLPGEMDELQIFTIGGTSKPCDDLVVNNRQLTMEIDTGAAVTCYRADISKALSRIIC